MSQIEQMDRKLTLAIEAGIEADLISDYYAAVKHFQNAVGTDVIESYIANIHLGWTHLHYGKPELAIFPFQNALLSKPDLVMAHLGLGHAYVELGDRKKATHNYKMVFPQKCYGGDPIFMDETNIWTSYFVKCGEMVLPLPYLTHSVFTIFNDIVNRLFRVSVLNFPYYYFLFIAKNKKSNLNLNSFKEKTLTTQIPFANNYCNQLNTACFERTYDKSEAVELIFSDIAVLLHERIFHFFDIIMCRICFDSLDTEAHAVLATASRTCNEGFAYWLQLRGLDSHNKKVPINASIDIELPERVFKNPNHPYSLGLGAFLEIEKKRGIEHAFLSYFIAYDFEEISFENLSKTSLISLFKKTRCNPNARLKTLAQLDITLTGSFSEDLQNTYKSLEKSLNNLNEYCTIGGTIK